jgi:Zn-dependent peptidase ImmA (M78 family)
MPKKRNLTPFTLPIPGWNKRRMTSRDFEAVCQREGITVERRKLTGSVRGFYRRQFGHPFITIDSTLGGHKRIQVEFHELGHYFLHDGKSDLMRKASDEETPEQRWIEIEAETCALVALAPRFDLNLFMEVLMVRAAGHVWGKGGAS